MSKFEFDPLILLKTSKFNLKSLDSSKNLCRINSLYPLMSWPLVHNSILLVFRIIGALPGQVLAAAAPVCALMKGVAWFAR